MRCLLVILNNKLLIVSQCNSTPQSKILQCDQDSTQYKPVGKAKATVSVKVTL